MTCLTPLRNRCALLAAAIVLLAAAPIIIPFPAAAKRAGEEKQLIKPPKGFTLLFDGRDLLGWWGARRDLNPKTYMELPPAELLKYKQAGTRDLLAHWHVDNLQEENLQLVSDGKGPYATTDKWYKDFELLIDYKAQPRADSGIYLRGCPQVQIWDATDPAKIARGADKGSGGLFNNSRTAPGKFPLVKADKPFGEWNHFRIVMIGDRVWVWLNYKKTVDGAVLENFYERGKPIPEQGPLQLQTHGGEIRWRNIFIRELGKADIEKFLKTEGVASGEATPGTTDGKSSQSEKGKGEKGKSSKTKKEKSRSRKSSDEE